MKKTVLWVALILVVVSLAVWNVSRSRRASAQVPMRVSWVEMGTIAGIQCPAGTSRAVMDDVAETVREVFAQDNAIFSAWSTNSVLAAVNAAAGSSMGVAVPEVFTRTLQRAAAFTWQSDGAFNPLIGPVMRLWGFNGAGAVIEPPRADILAATLANVNFHGVRSADGRVWLAREGMQLDFGAIAKGAAIDHAWQALRAKSVAALIDLGGNLRALGEAASNRCWVVGIRDPFQENAFMGAIKLRDGEAVATSGDYERFVMIGDTRYTHIMDGRTGWPVTGVAGVTVIAPDAETADALSTTLFILGPTEGQAFVRNYYSYCHALWVTGTPDAPVVTMTPGMIARRAEVEGDSQ